MSVVNIVGDAFHREDGVSRNFVPENNTHSRIIPTTLNQGVWFGRTGQLSYWNQLIGIVLTMNHQFSEKKKSPNAY